MDGGGSIRRIGRLPRQAIPEMDPGNALIFKDMALRGEVTGGGILGAADQQVDLARILGGLIGEGRAAMGAEGPGDLGRALVPAWRLALEAEVLGEIPRIGGHRRTR